MSFRSVMAGHTPSKTGVNALSSPAIHVFERVPKDVDARHKAGHDEPHCKCWIETGA